MNQRVILAAPKLAVIPDREAIPGMTEWRAICVRDFGYASSLLRLRAKRESGARLAVRAKQEWWDREARPARIVLAAGADVWR